MGPKAQAGPAADSAAFAVLHWGPVTAKVQENYRHTGVFMRPCGLWHRPLGFGAKLCPLLQGITHRDETLMMCYRP